MNFHKVAEDNPENSNGYVWVYLPDHPKSMSNGYIYEHRLVMEQFLGRFLKDNEQVQHKDGDQANNNIGNLELWIDDPKLGLIKENAAAKARTESSKIPEVLHKDYKEKKKQKKESSLIGKVVFSYLAKGSKI